MVNVMNTNENKGFMGSAVNCSFILADRKQDSEQVIPVLMSSAIKIDPKFASVLAIKQGQDEDEAFLKIMALRNK